MFLLKLWVVRPQLHLSTPNLCTQWNSISSLQFWFYRATSPNGLVSFYFMDILGLWIVVSGNLIVWSVTIKLHSRILFSYVWWLYIVHPCVYIVCLFVRESMKHDIPISKLCVPYIHIFCLCCARHDVRELVEVYTICNYITCFVICMY